MATLYSMPAFKLVELVNAVNVQKDMQIHVLSKTQLALGKNPLQPTHVIDLKDEDIDHFSRAKLANPLDHPTNCSPVEYSHSSSYIAKVKRQSGDYWFEFEGDRHKCRSLKELLSKGLIVLEQYQSGTLDKLSQIKPRSRRIVARDPKQLFDREHLTKDFSERLMNGWWFGTNNSARETNAWLERACSCASLQWGIEFKTSLTPTLEDLGL